MSDLAMRDLAMTVRGEGQAIVFLHGIGSSRHSFNRQLDYFTSKYLCICPDAPGYGDSADPAKPLANMDDFAAIYEAALKQYAPVVLVGVSFGGVLAARIASRSQIDVSALVLADSSRGSGVDPQRSAAMNERMAALRNDGNEAFAAARAPRLLSPAAEPSLVATVAANMASAIRLPGYGYAAAAMASTDNTSQLAQIHCPTLVLVGEHDMICPPSESQKLAALIPGASYCELPGAGHLSNQEVPNQFNQAIETFLAEHLTADQPSNPTTTKQTTTAFMQKELHHVKT